MRLIYWAELEDGPSTSHGLQGDEATALEVNPPEKVVAIASTRQQVCLAHLVTQKPVYNTSNCMLCNAVIAFCVLQHSMIWERSR